jgi:hypothetical protein
MMLLELLVASFGDALDPERHFSLFSALTDLLLVCGVCLAADVKLKHGFLRQLRG